MNLEAAARRVFAETYAEARTRLIAAAALRGASIKPYLNPNRGPDGGEIATDTLWLGPKDADNVLVMVSATHGVEGFPGSAAEIDWLLENGGRDLPDGVAVLIVHAINPYGFAWLRRVTEENVDLNRNFVDFSQPLPENPGYDELADAFVPSALDEATLMEADARVLAYETKHGRKELMKARTGGQYKHKGGMFYGGTEPTWSRRTLEALIADYDLPERELVAVLDYHTGLGPYGYGEPICGHTPGSINVERAKTWYGPSVTQPDLGTSSSVPKVGLAEHGWMNALGASVSCVALEFGTYPPSNGLRVLRQDHTLHNVGPVDWESEETRRIKEDIRTHFAPRYPDWQEMVIFRCRQMIGLGLRALSR